MQQLRDRKSKLKTAVSAFERGRQLVIEMSASHPAELLIREQGRRKGYWVPFVAIFTTGARLEGERRRQERIAKRKERNGK